MKWRRCCVDVDEDGRVIGGSVEFYDDAKLKPNCVLVLGRSEWNGLTPVSLLNGQLWWEWPVGQHGIILHGSME